MNDWRIDADAFIDFVIQMWQSAWELIKSNWILGLAFSVVVLSLVLSVFFRIRDLHRSK